MDIPPEVTELHHLLTDEKCPTVFMNNKTILDLANYLYENGVRIITCCKDCEYAVALDKFNIKCELENGYGYYKPLDYCEFGTKKEGI